MSLLTRLILGLCVLAMLMLFASGTVLQQQISSNYEHFERDAANKEMQRLVRAMEMESRLLDQLLLGWAHWSAMYEYTLNLQAEFASENLNRATLGPSDLSWILIMSPQGGIMNLVIAEDLEGEGSAITGELEALHFTKHFSSKDVSSSISGVKQIEDSLFLTSAMLVTDTAVKKTSGATIVLARKIDGDFLERVRRESYLDFSIGAISQPPAGYRGETIQSRVFGSNRIAIASSPESLEVHLPITDAEGKAVAEFRRSLPRGLIAASQASLNQAVLQIMAFGILFIALSIWVVDLVLVRRIRAMVSELDRISTSGNWSLRLKTRGKDEISRLSIQTNQLLEVIESRVQDLTTEAYTDSLTHLANRRAFENTLRLTVERAKRNGTSVEIIMIDVDWFKKYNDIYGHPAGDRALTLVASAIMSCARRDIDFTARIGGEEFAIIVEGANAEGSLTIAENLRGRVKALAIPHSGSEFSLLTISQGLARNLQGESEKSLYQRADQALYKAKQFGRDRIELAPSRVMET